jgi:hypothetical protein
MKNVVLFLISVVIGLLSILLFAHNTAEKNKKPFPKKNSTHFSIATPPSQSLIGDITSVVGEVAWESRVATEPAMIGMNRKIQQGEKLKTGPGIVVVKFANVAELLIDNNAEIDFSQTLPTGFVFHQTEGTITYSRLGEVPLSVRAMHVLIDQELGEISLTVNTIDQIVTVSVITGSIRVGFNDPTLNTNVLDVHAGEKLIFYDDTREVEIK